MSMSDIGRGTKTIETHPLVASDRAIAAERQPSPAAPWWHVPALVVAGLMLFTPLQSARPLEGDAAMYGTIARTIAETGEWTRLTFNGVPYLNKPPLFFWITAVVYDLVGFGRFGAQLVSGVLGVADVLLLYVVCRRMGFDASSSFAAGLVYVTTPEVAHWTIGVHLESLLTIWLLLGILATYCSLSRPSAILLLGVAVAGGWMSKGPQALFAVAIAPILWIRDRVLVARLFSIWTLVAALLVAIAVGPWTWARLSEGSGYAETYFRGQIGGVLLHPRHVDRHPLWYFGKLLQTYWPWLPFALVGLVTLARRWRSDAAARVWLTYGALVLAVTIAASARQARYLFPLYTMLAVASGVSLGRLARNRPWLLPGLVAIAFVAGVVVSLVDRETSSAASNRRRADVVEIAQSLPPDAEVWIASDVPQEGTPGITKVLGFAAMPRLCACAGRCHGTAEGTEGLLVVTLAQSADDLARQTGAAIERRNGTLAVLRAGPGSRIALRERVCAR